MEIVGFDDDEVEDIQDDDQEVIIELLIEVEEDLLGLLLIIEIQLRTLSQLSEQDLDTDKLLLQHWINKKEHIFKICSFFIVNISSPK